MEKYKPKRFEVHEQRGAYTIGFNIATEEYDGIRDFYLHIGLVFVAVTLVFLRLQANQNEK